MVKAKKTKKANKTKKQAKETRRTDKTKKNIVEYLKIINDYIFCKTINRKNCQYILDKLIIYEKYRDDVF